MKFGDFEIETFVEQRFKLDGGSMFGIVPRSIWQKLVTPDENNLIDFVSNVFVLKAHGKNFIFDCGLGDNLTDREKKVYGTTGESHISDGLQKIGLTEDDINFVLLTHLHTDHSGGAVIQVDDTYLPRFKNAKYIVSEMEYDFAMKPNERTAAAYKPERFQALRDSGQLKLIDGDVELFQGINLIHTGGHTPGHYAIEMESQGEKVFYYADIFMAATHLPVTFVSSSDLFPLDTMAVKRKKLPEIIENNVTMAFDHDTKTPFAKVKADGKRFAVEKVS